LIFFTIMNVFDAIKRRRSIRSYLDKDISDEHLSLILEAARQAPSASNRQEWRFVIVKKSAAKLKLCKAAKGQEFVKQAPVIIACCAQTDSHVMTCGQACYPMDIAIAIDHMTLAAVELGLGSCWVGAFYEEEVKKILDIPKDVRVVELLALGFVKKYPDYPKDRLSLKDITFFEKWGKSS
jgi:nitroreductase